MSEIATSAVNTPADGGEVNLGAPLGRQIRAQGLGELNEAMGSPISRTMLHCQRQWPPKRILVVDSALITAEVVAWCQRVGIEAEVFEGHRRGPELAVGRWYHIDVHGLLEHVARFEPDLVIQLNGKVDDGGLMGSLMSVLGLPWAVWHVDNPMAGARRTVFMAQRSPFTFPLVFDPAALRRLTEIDPLAETIEGGWRTMPPMPLATEPRLFSHSAQRRTKRDLSYLFVGSSLFRASEIALSVVRARELAWNEGIEAQLEADHDQWCRSVAAGAPLDNPEDVLRRRLRALWPDQDLDSPVDEGGELGLSAEGLLTLIEHRLTHRLRLRLVLAFLGEGITVVGDDGWRQALALSCQERGLHLDSVVRPPVDYYSELPDLYRRSQVVLNATRPAVWSAYNQRVLDATLAGSVVFTDPRELLFGHFGPAGRAMCSVGVEEIKRQVHAWRRTPSERAPLEADLKRHCLHEHSYDVRMPQVLRAIESTGIPTHSLSHDKSRLRARLDHPQFGPPTLAALRAVAAFKQGAVQPRFAG